MTTDAATLNALLGRIALQDRAAFNALYTAIGAQMLAVAHRLLRDRAMAEDVLQEVFVTLWTRAGRYPPVQTNPFGWLTSMVRNKAIDKLRARQAPEVPLQWTDANGEEHSHDVADASGSPLEQLIGAESEGGLARCLGRLDPVQRQVVMLAYYDGLTHVQLAAQLKHPLGTIKAWVRRSLLKLKDCLCAEGLPA